MPPISKAGMLGMLAGAGGGAGTLGMWTELGRAITTGTTDTITISDLPNKPYLMVICQGINSGQINPSLRFNGDSSNNYARRYSVNGGSDTTETSQPEIELSSSTHPQFFYAFIDNYADDEKLVISHSVSRSSAGASAPDRFQVFGKWDNTSDVISSLTVYNNGSGDFDANTQVIVLGYDPADLDTSAWTELASVDVSSSDIIDTGTMSTTKKYLMVECFVEHSGSANVRWRFNGVSTGTKYGDRENYNMGSDATQTANNIDTYSWVADASTYVIGFIENNADTEKLCIFNMASPDSAGAGNPPNFGEIVGKFINTGSQINQISVNNTTTGDYAKGYLRVWGMD